MWRERVYIMFDSGTVMPKSCGRQEFVFLLRVGLSFSVSGKLVGLSCKILKGHEKKTHK